MNSGVSSAAIPLKLAISLKAPFMRAFGRGTVVADDVVDDRVLEDPEVVDRVDQPADVVVGVLEEPGVDLHLPGQHRLELVGHVVPGGDLGVPRGQLGVGGDDPQLLLPGEGALPLRRPTRRRTDPAYRSAHSFGTWCGAWVAPGAK